MFVKAKLRTSIIKSNDLQTLAYILVNYRDTMNLCISLRGFQWPGSIMNSNAITGLQAAWKLLMGVGEWLITIDCLVHVVGELPIGSMVKHLSPKTNEMYH